MSATGIIPASSFVGTLSANVDNTKMSDAEFRAFVRRTLPSVEGYPRSAAMSTAHAKIYGGKGAKKGA